MDAPVALQPAGDLGVLARVVVVDHQLQLLAGVGPYQQTQAGEEIVDAVTLGEGLDPDLRRFGRKGIPADLALPHPDAPRQAELRSITYRSIAALASSHPVAYIRSLGPHHNQEAGKPLLRQLLRGLPGRSVTSSFGRYWDRPGLWIAVFLRLWSALVPGCVAFGKRNCVRRSWPVGIKPTGRMARYGDNISPSPLVCLPRPPLFREALLFNATVAITDGHLLSDVRKSSVERVVPQEGLCPPMGRAWPSPFSRSCATRPHQSSKDSSCSAAPAWNAQHALIPCEAGR